MKNMKFLRSNFKFLTIMFGIIVMGMLGITYAVILGKSNPIALNIDTASMDVSISYDSAANGSTISSTGNMLPISDDLVTGTDVNDDRIVKVKFIVSGVSNNPSNSIYDVVLRDIVMDCDLKNEYLKWRLYKNDTLLSSGNFSPTFDTMEGDRLVLTETQQDLNISSDTYVFLMWISESCPETTSIEECTSDLDQSKFLNKNFSANIKLELATNGKKALVRTVGSDESCNYISTTVPSCNDLTYNGGEQQLINNRSAYSLVNYLGTEAGKYVVTAKLNDGYKWSDGTISDKLLNCNIKKKQITVTALNQEIIYGEEISNNIDNINISDLVSGDSLASFSIKSSIVDVGSGTINISNIKILNSSGEDVTGNYSINSNEGKVIINCLNLSEEPTISDSTYNGNVQVGVSGGKYVTLSGNLSGTSVDTYTAYAEPIKNYCWYDGKTDKKKYTWQITNAEKSDPILTVSSSSLDTSSLSSNDLDYTYDGDGDVSCGSSDTSVATCTVDSASKKLTIKSVGAGTATVTLNAAASDLYTSASKKISVSVTGNLSGGSVKITGTNTYGETLTATVTDTTPSASYQYQWYYNTTNSTTGGTLISGANISTYEIGSGLAGKYIYVVVTASKSSYNSKSFSDITDDDNNTTATVSKADPQLDIKDQLLFPYYPSEDSTQFQYLGDGIVSCSSSDTSIATCSVENSNEGGLGFGELIITPGDVRVGQVEITLNIAEGTDYKSTSDTVRCQISYKSYQVTLDNQSATSSGTTTLYGLYYNGIFLDSSHSTRMTTSTNPITVPTKTGYTFNGYYTDGSILLRKQLLSDSGYITSSFTNSMYSSDVTLYAKWTAKTYTVSYDANGGSGAPDSQIKTYGKTLTLSSTVPTKSGYAFKGWSTSSTATTATYSAGGSYTTNASTTLYAVWTNEFTVAIYVDGSLETSEAVSVGSTYTATNIYVPWNNASISCDNGSGSITGTTGDYTVTVSNLTDDTICNITK
ncbi:MAG: InlB B-repeat-containing protein [Bacilli bacterium]